MSHLQVDSAQIAQAAANTALIAQELRQQATLMLTQVQNLSQSWNGAAAGAFADCANRWRTAQLQMEAALDAIAHSLSVASTQYEQTENGVSAMFMG